MEETNQKSLLKNQELIVENNEEVTQEIIENRTTEAKEIDAFFKVLNFFDKTPEEFENLLTILLQLLEDIQEMSSQYFLAQIAQ